MEAGFVVLMIAAAIIVGVIVGIFIGKHINRERDLQGVLFVDCSNPEYEPTLFLNATVPINEIVARKQVVFDVNIIR